MADLEQDEDTQGKYHKHHSFTATATPWWDMVSTVCLVLLLASVILCLCFILPTIFSIRNQVRQIDQLDLVNRVENVLSQVESMALPTLKNAIARIDQKILPDIDKFMSKLGEDFPLESIKTFFESLFPTKKSK